MQEISDRCESTVAQGHLGASPSACEREKERMRETERLRLLLNDSKSRRDFRPVSAGSLPSGLVKKEDEVCARAEEGAGTLGVRRAR